MGLLIATAMVPLLFGLWAQMKVKRTFAKYSQVAPRNGMSGAEAAAAVLRSSGLPNLQIRPVAGRLSDHYDPRNRTLNLSQDVGDGSWFGGEPIWVTAAQEGVGGAAFFWTGSEAEIEGHRPTCYRVYDPNVADSTKVDQVAAWLR